MLDAFFAQFYARNPVTATFTGVHTYDGELPDWSLNGLAADAREMRDLRTALDRDNSPDDSLDQELARANIDVRLAEAESGHFVQRNPSLWTGEAIFGVVSLMLRDFGPVADRAVSIRARLKAIPGFLLEMRRVLVGPVPRLWKLRAVRECGVARGLLADGLDLWGRSQGLNGFTTEGTEGAEAIEAFRSTEEWLCGLEDGDAGVSCGESLLGTLLLRGHFCEEAPRALLTRALSAMEVEAAALARTLEKDFGGSWANAQSAMAADRPSTNDYLATFARRWEEIRRAAIAADMVSWPEWPIRYVPVPQWARAAQPQLYWLFYRSPAPFDVYTTYDYVVTPVDDSMTAEEQTKRLSVWNHSTITLNHVVHHGGLGHHVQNWHARHRERSRVGAVSAVDAANRIAMFLGGSMAEGWACYATRLAEELGVLTPLERVSEQHTRVRLLARAIVDLRLHLGDWSFDECVAYYQLTVGMSSEVATAETTKNSMFPATALMYWLGTQGIRDLREQQRSAQGAAFSLRAFHDELLSRGAIPVPLVARLMSSQL